MQHHQHRRHRGPSSSNSSGSAVTNPPTGIFASTDAASTTKSTSTSTSKKGSGKKLKNRGKEERALSTKELRRLSEAKELSNLEESLAVDPNVWIAENGATLARFDQLPISRVGKAGLAKSNYVELTEIQKASLPFSLAGRDVLGAAKTGSGKTLAFVVPMLEKLYREKWTPLDGLGALVISPTRELAIQIFEVVRKVGRFYSFSAGLLIGGKDLLQEQERVAKMNILVCTPGRLLQHMDQTPDFSCDNLQILVLDEADRCLDGGFERTLNAIIENLPNQGRQTLLFSATQTKSVKDLARLSLVDPEYVNVHETSESATPLALTQRYAVLELNQKLDMLFSFLKTHLKQKILVFVSSCKQVRFIFETFCKLHPGIPLMHLHGKQKQPKRLAIFETFCRKTAVCLFATDVAARGLDFPAVDWVLQLDCPEDVSTYIHRVGRTARNEQPGNALMFLTPSEEPGMLAALEKRKVRVEKIRVNPARIKSTRQQMVMFCSKDPEIKYLGQKAFISYVRSVHLQSNKEVFDVSKLPLEEFADSLGLPGAPVIKFLKKSANAVKNAVRQKQKDLLQLMPGDEVDEKIAISGDEGDDESEDSAAAAEEEDDKRVPGADKKNQTVTKVDKMFQAKNKTVLSEHYNKLRAQDQEDGSSDEEFFGVVRKDHDVEDVQTAVYPERAPTKKELSKAKLKELASRGISQKIEYDEDGNPIDHALETLAEFEAKGSVPARQAAHLEAQTEGMKVADIDDKSIMRAKRREKKLAQKAKEREALGLTTVSEPSVRLHSQSEIDQDDNNESGDNSSEMSDDGSSVTFDGERGHWESDAALSDSVDDNEYVDMDDINLDEDERAEEDSGKRRPSTDSKQAVQRKKQKISSYLAKTQDLESMAAGLLRR
ncbi:ATP-dependent RNA helicase dbp4 [Entophlyctis sp. JEL0112]|nr:ATP-dependent RNA helicase dbp4 [Entophlyctis sp. JEL0112]